MFDTITLDDALDELESAEDFLTYFEVAFEPSVVQVSRLHILQRYHDYLADAPTCDAGDDARRTAHRDALTRACWASSAPARGAPPPPSSRPTNASRAPTRSAAPAICC